MFCTPLSMLPYIRAPYAVYVSAISPVSILWMDFSPNVLSFFGASWDKDELVRFWGQTVKGQGHKHSLSQ